MSIKKISKEELSQLVSTLIASGDRVEGVQAKDDKFAFGPLTSADDLRLDYDVTLLSPRKYVLPPVESLMTFEVGGRYQSEYDTEKLTLIGVHPYDMIALNQIDQVFSQDEVDNHYTTRRKNMTLIACDVVTPSENVFASSMGTATVSEGYDILLTDIGDAYVADAPTEKGQALLCNAADATAEDLAKRQAVQERNQSDLNRHPLNCKIEDLPQLLEKAYDHPVWEEKAASCFSCGSCNQVCPTCYCFNVQDDVSWDLKSGTRSRAWDGCLLENFANVAGDHNFRKKRNDRFRHRLYRKGKYVPEKLGIGTACVGCGRCITACVPGIANPVDIYNTLLNDIKL
ncbi:MAG: 4Fe-4S dicluster domain-containing protein [Phycisphaerae bacterium]|nr:4Fe-4S dicluster domain-containing protein [Phycisphaerae bacterium]